MDPIQDGSNWYTYCHNNPLGFTDPTGLFDVGMLATNVKDLVLGAFQTAGGIAMASAGGASEVVTIGASSLLSVPLTAVGTAIAIDGAVRTATAGAKVGGQLVTEAIGTVKAAENFIKTFPDNIGGFIGAGIDMLTGNKDQSAQKAGGFINDFASMAAGVAGMAKGVMEAGTYGALILEGVSGVVGGIDDATSIATQAAEFTAPEPAQNTPVEEQVEE